MGYRSAEVWADDTLADISSQQGDVAAATFHARRSLHLMRTHGVLTWLRGGLGSLAWVATQVGDGERAARLLGACVADTKRHGVVGYEEAHTGDVVYARIRAALGEERWAAAFEAGLALSREEAIAEALGESVMVDPSDAAGAGYDC